MQMRVIGALVAVALLLGGTGQASADTIIDFTGTTGTNGDAGLLGQEVLTPSGGPSNDITFSFLNETATETLVASGAIFLLDQAYVGQPGGLSSSTPGFLAESTGASAGAWDFASSVTLQPNTNYWFYASANLGFNTITGRDPGLAGDTFYAVLGGNQNFGAFPSLTADFRLSGDPITADPITASGQATVPEPGSLTLFGAGALAMLGAGRWRKRKQTARA